MKKGILLIFGIVVILGVGVGIKTTTDQSSMAGGEDVATEELVILELFTSQGCSSCPPAESVLSKIAMDDRYKSSVVPLAFHVDYWDYLGWQDPFSNTAWTERQANYREAFGEATLYTPQIVIQGEYELVGSDENNIKRKINEVLSRSSDRLVDISIEGVDVSDAKTTADILVHWQDSTVKGTFLLMSALFENVEATNVVAGENAGRTLRNNYVVRSMDIEPILFGEKKKNKRFQVSLLLEDDWQIDNMGLVSWVQDPHTMKIYRVDVVNSL